MLGLSRRCTRPGQVPPLPRLPSPGYVRTCVVVVYILCVTLDKLGRTARRGKSTVVTLRNLATSPNAKKCKERR